MGSVKIVLRKKVNKDGTFPIAIRITKNRRSSFVHVGQSIKETEWDALNQKVKKSHPNSARLNNFLLRKMSEANDKLLELETEKKEVSSQAVKYSLRPLTKGATFFAFAELYLDNFKKSGKYNRLNSDQSRIKKFKEFLNGSDIAFQDITIPLLNRFRADMKSQGLCERSVINNLLIIRTVFNMAIKGNKIDKKHYPFGNDKVQIKFPNSSKIGLSMEEVKRLEEIGLEPGSYLNHARNVWIFSFYFAGMRVSDILRLKWSDFQDDRLYYSMVKNTKFGSLKIPEKALRILSQYEGQRKEKDEVVFPELKILKNLDNQYEVERKISYAVKRLNKSLSKLAEMVGISKKLTMHIARHTFGNISGEKISLQMLQKLYRHSSITTTIGYQANFIHKDADEALDSVIGA